MQSQVQKADGCCNLTNNKTVSTLENGPKHKYKAMNPIRDQNQEWSFRRKTKGKLN